MTGIGALIENLLRWIFSWIDRLVIVMMNLIYHLLINLSSLNIVDAATIKSFSTRIGLILGIFMLFNLAINLLNYIVSPDKVSDKGKGGAKLVLNIVISLVLLVTYNWIFETGYKVQHKIISKQILPQIIFGTSPEEDPENVEIAYYVFSSMISVNSNVDKEGVCQNSYYEGITDECDDLLSGLLRNSYQQFEAGVINKDASKLVNAENITAQVDDEYIFDYLFLFSTIVGVIVTLIMFNFCIDIAKRSVKLYFYQIIAPLPIVSNMIPGKGEEMFKKWYKSCFSTYLDLFIRLIALFFAIFIITTFYGSVINNLPTFETPILGIKLVKVLGIFIILGALMFAKELPQLVQDLTGLKLDGSFAINPIKKLNQVPVVGKGLGAIGGAAAGARAGARVGNTLGGAWAGAFMGATSVPLGGSKNGDPILTSAANNVYKKMTGSDFINFSFIKQPLRIGAKARIDEIKDARNVATDQLNSYNSQLNISESMTSNIANELSKKGININNLTVEKGRLQELKNNGNSISEDEYNSAKNSISNLTNERNKYEELLHYANAAGDTAQAKELQERIREATSKINTAEALKRQFEQNEEYLKGIDGTLELIEKYSGGMDEQNELRKRISTVQKDIDDLSKEKAQRERFYDYDPSPQGDIQKIMEATKSAESYEDRIDDRVKPKK